MNNCQEKDITADVNRKQIILHESMRTGLQQGATKKEQRGSSLRLAAWKTVQEPLYLSRPGLCLKQTKILTLEWDGYTNVLKRPKQCIQH